MIKNISDYISLGVLLFLVFSTARIFVGSITTHHHKKTKGLGHIFREFASYSENSEE